MYNGHDGNVGKQIWTGNNEMWERDLNHGRWNNWIQVDFTSMFPKKEVTFEEFRVQSTGREGGFARIGPIGIEWRNNVKAASAATHRPTQINFSKLSKVSSVQCCIYGDTTGALTCKRMNDTTFQYWGSHDNIWFNTWAIGKVD